MFFMALDCLSFTLQRYENKMEYANNSVVFFVVLKIIFIFASLNKVTMKNNIPAGHIVSPSRRPLAACQSKNLSRQQSHHSGE